MTLTSFKNNSNKKTESPNPQQKSGKQIKKNVIKKKLNL